MGENGTVLATTNGGATWREQDSGSSKYLQAVAFTDATHGWAVGGDEGPTVILATTNGGATWGAQRSGSDSWLQAVAFTDATHGWAVGSGGVILATTDGGGPRVPARYKVTPPAVPHRVRAGTQIESWGRVRPALKAGSRIVVFWDHYIGGRWQMVRARQPADSYRNVFGSTKYSVRMVFAAGKWRVRAEAADVISAYRVFTAY